MPDPDEFCRWVKTKLDIHGTSAELCAMPVSVEAIGANRLHALLTAIKLTWLTCRLETYPVMTTVAFSLIVFS